jgi:anti-sigma B factor antagonist
MRYSHQIIDNVLLIRFEENLMVANFDQSLLLLIEDCLQNGIIYCAVDLSQIRFMNSSGISILMRILTKFRSNNGEMVLIKPSQEIYKLLIITKLNAIFTVVENEQEAIKMLKM